MTMDMKTDFNNYEVLPKWGLSLSAGTEEASFQRFRSSVFVAARVSSMTMHPCPAIHCFWSQEEIATRQCLHNVLSAKSHRNKIFIYATTWMVLENIMLSKISQAEKDKYYLRFHLYEESRTGKNQTDGRKEVTRGWEQRERVVIQWV